MRNSTYFNHRLSAFVQAIYHPELDQLSAPMCFTSIDIIQLL